MPAFAPQPLLPAHSYIFRHYLSLRYYLPSLRLTAAAIREARQRRRQQRHEARMLSFYSWCEACRGLGSIF